MKKYVVPILAACIFAAPANAQFVGPNPPGIQSPGCAGDCSIRPIRHVHSGRYADMLDAATVRLLVRAHRALRAERSERARRSFRLALERRPDHAEVHYHVGLGHYISGDTDGARALFETALTGADHGKLTDEQRALALKVLGKLS